MGRGWMAELTHLFLDFDGVLTDNFVYVNEKGEEMVRCSRSDGIGIQKLKDKGITVCIMSTETNPVVCKRAEKLNVHCLQGISDKLQALKEMDAVELSKTAFMGRDAVDLSKTAFMGNDLNDLKAMQAVGIPIAPADARPEIRDIAKYVTKARGGNGAVREACGWVIAKYL